MEISENMQKMARGELYFAFTPELIAARSRCELACSRFNSAGVVSRRKNLEMWREITRDSTPLPPPAATEEADEELLAQEPWIRAPIYLDYGTNVKVGKGAFINFNCTIIDTCLVSIGERTMFGPNVSIFSGSHPEDPLLRNGLNGPEWGKEVIIEDDVWIGGNVIILPGVKIGKGAVIGAGSVVTKTVPPLWIAAGNPARLMRRVKTEMTSDESTTGSSAATAPAKEVVPIQTSDNAGYRDEDQGW